MAERKRKTSGGNDGQSNVKKLNFNGSQLYPVDFIKTEMDVEDVVEAPDVTNAGYIMNCEKCDNVVEATSQNLSHHRIFGEHSSRPRHRILSLVCRSDGRSPHTVGLRIKDSWWSVNEVLTSHDIYRDGIQKVTTFGEHIVLSVLNGIVADQELQSRNDPVFELHAPGEMIKIMWQEGQAVGFYSIKRKGKLISPYSGEVWAMNVLDTIYVRKNFRRKGLATAMLEHFLESYPKEDVGLSFPIEKAMLKVCHQVMIQRTVDQDRLWECQEPGHPGQRRNVWLTVNKPTLTKENGNGN